MTALAEKQLPKALVEVINKAPALLAKPLAFMPEQLCEPLFNFTLNKVFHQALLDEELDFLTNQWLKLTLTDANFHCFITVLENNNGVKRIDVKKRLPSQLEKADVEFSADVNSLAMMARKQLDPDTLFFQRKLMVTGKTELGLAIKNFLDDFDFTESLPESIQKLVNKIEAKLQ